MLINIISHINARKNKILKNLYLGLLNIEKEILIQDLKYVGKECFFQMPICITGHNQIEIGDYVSIAAYVHIWGDGGVKIGNRVMIASHTAITSLSHNYTQEDMYRTVVSASVNIEDDVWIGAHTVILPGVSIGKGAVIGAGSIVTKNIESYSIAFGCPAKHYKYREIPTQN
ncbi:MAG TPA: acyltransferase [Leptolyngbyaceae cyanobacterium]